MVEVWGLLVWVPSIRGYGILYLGVLDCDSIGSRRFFVGMWDGTRRTDGLRLMCFLWMYYLTVVSWRGSCTETHWWEALVYCCVYTGIH